jgi:hypothetical protein
MSMPFRETLIARFDGIRQFAQGGRRAPHKSLLLLYALARLKHDRQTQITFNTAEAALRPLLRTYAPQGGEAHDSYPYSVSLRLAYLGALQPIPAGAAVVHSYGSRFRAPVHPRRCGERVHGVELTALWAGSSPRVRGTRSRLHCRRPGRRVIPAGAGNAP